MRQIAKVFIAGFLMASLSLSNASSEETDVMYDFYDGFADIIETYGNDPDTCVKESQVYINNKAASLKESARHARAAAGQSSVSEEEIAEWVREHPRKAQRDDMAAVKRFAAAFQAFQQRYPEHAAGIKQMMEEKAR